MKAVIDRFEEKDTIPMERNDKSSIEVKDKAPMEGKDKEKEMDICSPKDAEKEMGTKEADPNRETNERNEMNPGSHKASGIQDNLQGADHLQKGVSPGFPKKRSFTCIICPRGCEIEAVLEDGEPSPLPEGQAGAPSPYRITGEGCKRGRAYVLQELTDPRRTIATSMRVLGGEQELISVRLSASIPKRQIMEAVKEIHGKTLTAPVKAGEVVLSSLLGLDCDVIATKDVDASRTEVHA